MCPRTKAMKENKKEKVLCVEDNEDECELIKEILHDFEVICVSTVSDACQHMDDAKYALIILDEHLPDGSGMHFCKEISRSNTDTPIVMVSGDTYITAAEAQAAGAKCLLTKSSVTYIEDLDRIAQRYAVATA